MSHLPGGEAAAALPNPVEVVPAPLDALTGTAMVDFARQHVPQWADFAKICADIPPGTLVASVPSLPDRDPEQKLAGPNYWQMHPVFGALSEPAYARTAMPQQRRTDNYSITLPLAQGPSASPQERLLADVNVGISPFDPVRNPARAEREAMRLHTGEAALPALQEYAGWLVDTFVASDEPYKHNNNLQALQDVLRAAQLGGVSAADFCSDGAVQATPEDLYNLFAAAREPGFSTHDSANQLRTMGYLSGQELLRFLERQCEAALADLPLSYRLDPRAEQPVAHHALLVNDANVVALQTVGDVAKLIPMPPHIDSQEARRYFFARTVAAGYRQHAARLHAEYEAHGSVPAQLGYRPPAVQRMIQGYLRVLRSQWNQLRLDTPDETSSLHAHYFDVLAASMPDAHETRRVGGLAIGEGPQRYVNARLFWAGLMSEAHPREFAAMEQGQSGERHEDVLVRNAQTLAALYERRAVIELTAYELARVRREERAARSAGAVSIG